MKAYSLSLTVAPLLGLERSFLEQVENLLLGSRRMS